MMRINKIFAFLMSGLFAGGGQAQDINQYIDALEESSEAAAQHEQALEIGAQSALLTNLKASGTLFLPMDELVSGTLPDTAGTPNPGILVGSTAATRFQAGVRGKSIAFTDADYVTVNNAVDVDIATEDFSMFAWVKTINSTQTIFDKRASEGGAGYLLRIHSGDVLFQMATSSGWANFISSTPVLINDGKWHLIGVTVDRDLASGGKLYVDGRVVHTFNPTGFKTSMSNNQKLSIGHHGFSGGHFTGSIDEPFIVKRVLSNSEINSLIPVRGIPSPRVATGGSLSVGSPTDTSLTVTYNLPSVTSGMFEICWTSNFALKDDPCANATTFHTLTPTPTSGSVVADKLTPNTDYYFGLAYRKDMSAYENLTQAEGKTNDSAVVATPQENKLWVESETETTAQVHWVSTVNMSYLKVCWAKVGALDICNGNSKNIPTESGAGIRKTGNFPIADLTPGSTYKLKMYAEGDRGSPLQDTRFSTKDRARVDVWVSDRRTTELGLTWTANSTYSSYSICWKRAGSLTNCEGDLRTVNAPQTNYYVGGLSSGKKYRVKVYGNLSGSRYLLWDSDEKTKK